MSTAEELLNSVLKNEASVLSASDAVFVIDGESRTINVPDSERLFGVEGDKDVERKYFQCPKIVGDNIDLSQHQIYVSYVFTTTENNTVFPTIGNGLYHCDDVEVSGDNITFSWLLSGNVFANPGFIAFKVMAKKSEGGELKTKWNTAPAIGTVLLTVPDGEDIAEEYPDVINQIFDRLNALESGGGGGTGGTTNYENLSNKPQLNGVTLEGNKTLDQVGVLAKNQGSSNSGKYLSVGSDGNVAPADAPSVNPEQIKQAVNGYLEENPPSGMTAEEKEQLDKNTEDISSLSEEKLNKNQGISNSGKYLVVGADGNITFSDESTDSPEKPLGDYNYSLPDGYKKVDYIDSKGTLHYFLNWTPTVNSRMVQKVIPIEGVNTFIGFGADNNLSFGYQINVSGKKVSTYLGDSFGNSKSEKSFEPDYKQYITVDIANGSQKVEGLEIGTKTSIFDVYESWNNKYPIVGGAFQTWYSSGSVIALTRHKLVRCQIYESEELVYDFVPALRDTDNVCGLYDLVNSAFASGRTYDNSTQSYDYGEIIDDTGGQNGENAENTHIIVSEMTGDAIQDAINQCKSSGGGVIELLPGGVYICDSPLTIYTDRVDIIGNGAKLDFSGISSDIVCVTLQSSGDISDYSEMIREEYLHYIRGVYFVGPNRTANYEGGRIGTALVFTGTETKISTGYTVDNCVIAGFKTGVDLFTNSWCVKFSNCDISVCDTGIQMISGGQNYGEKFTFTSCTIHSCSVGAVCNHNAGTLQFLGCAMDYNFCAFKTDNQAHIIFTGGHIENNKDKNYFCICSNFGIVLIANSVLHGSQTQYGFASVSEAGKVIMSNCMKEFWTMGEDEKDDNGNSKIIYGWINFAS